MKEKLGVDCQFFPPDIHRQNADDRYIKTFKAHFLATMAGVAYHFPRHIQDLLLPHAEVTINLLQQTTSNPAMSTWEFSSEAFNYDATPLVQLGISVILHTKTTIILSWDFCGKYGWSVGVTLKHYQCQRVIPKCTRKMMILDTTEFRHHHLTQASVTPAYRVLHGMQHLTSALQGTPSSRYDVKMTGIQ